MELAIRTELLSCHQHKSSPEQWRCRTWQGSVPPMVWKRGRQGKLGRGKPCMQEMWNSFSICAIAGVAAWPRAVSLAPCTTTKTSEQRYLSLRQRPLQLEPMGGKALWARKHSVAKAQ